LGEWVWVLNDYLMGLAVVLTVITGVDYLVRGVRAPRSADAASR